MYCPNCGAYNEASYNNCTSCGKYIGDINKAQGDAEENEKKKTQSYSDAAEQKKENFFSDYEKQSNSNVAGDNTASASKTAFNAEQNNEFKRRSVYKQYTSSQKDYFVFSIICAVLFSLTFGLAAVVFSVMTKVEVSSGNLKRAETYSVNAKRFCIISLVIGIIKYLFIFFMFTFVWNAIATYPMFFTW